LGRDFFFSSDILRALHEHTRWDFYFGSFRGRRHDGRNGLGSGHGRNLGAKFFFDFVEVDFTDGARDRLGIRRHVAALLEPSEE
jgi:hypothetical protein